MRSLVIITMEDHTTRNYSFECHSPMTAADIITTTVRNLDKTGGQVLAIHTI